MTDLVNGWKHLFSGAALSNQEAVWAVGSAVLALIILNRD